MWQGVKDAMVERASFRPTQLQRHGKDTQFPLQSGSRTHAAVLSSSRIYAVSSGTVRPAGVGSSADKEVTRVHCPDKISGPCQRHPANLTHTSLRAFWGVPFHPDDPGLDEGPSPRFNVNDWMRVASVRRYGFSFPGKGQCPTNGWS